MPDGLGLVGFGPGSLAVWEMGDAMILAAMDTKGEAVEVTVMDRGWDGEKRQERYRIARTADGTWSADTGTEGGRQAADWAELLPVPCHLVSPTEVTVPDTGSAPAF